MSARSKRQPPASQAPKPPRTSKGKASVVDWDAVVARYECSNDTAEAIAQKHGVTARTVYNQLTQRNAFERRAVFRGSVAAHASEKMFADKVALLAECKVAELEASRRRVELAMEFLSAAKASDAGSAETERVSRMLEAAFDRWRRAIGADREETPPTKLVLAWAPSGLRPRDPEKPEPGGDG